MSEKKQICMYETYKNTVMPHGIIFTPNHMTQRRQQCVHFHNQIMRYHTGNVYGDVVPNLQALILLTTKHMISIPTTVLQFFSHLSFDCTLYKTWKAFVNQQGKFWKVSTGYCFRTKRIYIH